MLGSRLVLLAAALAARTAANEVTCRLYGVGADYFDVGLHSMKCLCQPVNASWDDGFYTSCTRDTAYEYAGQVVTLEIADASESGSFPDSAQLAAEQAVGIVRPETYIADVKGTTNRRRRRDVPDGPRSTLVMLINYADAPVGYATEASAALMMQNPNGKDVDELFRATSYGRQQWPASQTRVITVNSSLNAADQTGCPFLAMSQASDQLVATQHPDINMDDYVHKAYLIPSEVPGCGWGGVAYVGTCANGPGAYCKAWIRVNSATVLAHELGHNVGTIHAADDYDDDGTQGAEYGDWTDVMGRARWTSMNAPHRELLGYLGDGLGAVTYDMDCAAHTGTTTTMRIARLDETPGTTSNPNMVRIARYPSSNYLLSFKSPSDWDADTLRAEYQNSLVVHSHNGARVNTLLIGGYSNGETFTGTANRDGASVPLTVTVVGVNNDFITVEIDTDCGTRAPTQTGQTYAPTPGPTAPQNFQGNITCGQTVTGDTTGIGSIVGNPAGDHYFHFSLAQSTTVTFDGCASSYDTWIRVFNRGLTTEAAGCDDCGNCASSTRTRLVTTLPAGDHAMVIEGYSSSEGQYSIRFGCGGTETTEAPLTVPPGAEICAYEGETCTCTGDVYYGFGSRWAARTGITSSVRCTNGIFGDPYPGQRKQCMCDGERGTTPAPPTGNPATSAPVTSAPVTPAPTTSSPVTSSPVTSAPIAVGSTTTQPPNQTPTNPPPSTSAPATSSPTTSEPTVFPGCSDDNSNCPLWARLGYCVGDHDIYMQENCKLSCHTCDDNEHITPPRNTGASTAPPEPDTTEATTTVPPTTSSPTTKSPTTSSPTIPPPTTPPPTNPSCKMVKCGRYINGSPVRTCSEQERCAPITELHEVRCCSDTAIDGWAVKFNQCPWTESNNWNSDVTACQHSKDFNFANDFCASVGARLCTVDEVERGCTGATGCGHDRDLIWTSDDSETVFQLAMNNGGSFIETTTDEPTTLQQTNLASGSGASSSVDNSDDANDGAIAGAILGTLGVCAAIAAVLYVRSQRSSSSKTIENGAVPALELPGVTHDDSEEVFKLAPDGASIRLESVKRGNPMYRNSIVPQERRKSLTATQITKDL